ncbi:MAG: ABC transporter ATP-binding protein, partial [Planctomycetota bacterium]|nr:ABC transporter ATP-binding protein [Planctomycetota bacterium]
PISELEKCANDACIAESIDKLKNGYETLIGERGITLSGGQRQRLALARALVRDAPILVLDDALSAVDTKTEGLIRGALAERKSKRTTIIISHRLSSVLHADRILVLEKGQLVQWGSHDELLQESGPYQRLWAIQERVEKQIKEPIQLISENKGVNHDRKESKEFQPTAS